MTRIPSSIIITTTRLKDSHPMAKNERTSKAVAKKASKVMRDPKATASSKSIAASALTQTADRKRK